jgi:integrase/recombinase XerD
MFVSRQAEQLTRHSLHKMLVRIADRASVERCSPHRIRHTAALAMVRNGMDPLTLKRVLGHASLEMTMRYVNLNTADLQSSHAAASPIMRLGIRERDAL